MHTIYGKFAGSEWRLARRYRNGVIVVTDDPAKRTEKVARKAADRMNARLGTTYSEFIAIRVELRHFVA